MILRRQPGACITLRDLLYDCCPERHQKRTKRRSRARGKLSHGVLVGVFLRLENRFAGVPDLATRADRLSDESAGALPANDK
jgi:hypothetical protein